MRERRKRERMRDATRMSSLQTDQKEKVDDGREGEREWSASTAPLGIDEENGKWCPIEMGYCGRISQSGFQVRAGQASWDQFMGAGQGSRVDASSKRDVPGTKHAHQQNDQTTASLGRARVR